VTLDPTGNPALDAWIPHRGAMRLLDRIVEVDAETAVAEVRVPFDGLFTQDGQVPAWVGIEYMAQTISAWAAGRQREHGGEGPKLGLLLGSRRYVAQRGGFPCGAVLRIATRCEIMGDNGLGMFDCRIEMDGQEVATATLSVFEPEDALAFLKRETAA
jgi:predicted hotdog family 3-hydroxylacyl-ACP dehydratase